MVTPNSEPRKLKGSGSKGPHFRDGEKQSLVAPLLLGKEMDSSWDAGCSPFSQYSAYGPQHSPGTKRDAMQLTKPDAAYPLSVNMAQTANRQTVTTSKQQRATIAVFAWSRLQEP